MNKLQFCFQFKLKMPFRYTLTYKENKMNMNFNKKVHGAINSWKKSQKKLKSSQILNSNLINKCKFWKLILMLTRNSKYLKFNFFFVSDEWIRNGFFVNFLFN